MTDSTSEQKAAATMTAKDKREETTETTQPAALVTPLNLRSEVIIFNDDGEFKSFERDGRFELDITDPDNVTGTHFHDDPPSENEVTGALRDGVITLTAEDVRMHFGLDLGNAFIGIRRPLNNNLLSQEEGVWVGTKVGLAVSI